MDEPQPDEAARAKLAAQALGWLRTEIDAWTKVLESGQPQDRASAVRALKHWQTDTDLTIVRDIEALAKLPEAERKGWQALWADVDALLKKAEATPK